MNHFTGRAVLRVCAAGRTFPAALLAVLMSFPVVAGAQDLGATQTLPSEWSTTNVGKTRIPGTATYSNGTFTVEGVGNGMYSKNDQFFYVHQRVTGDTTMIARVGSIEYTAAWAKAGIMIRESLAVGSRHAFSLVTPGGGTALQHRATTDGATAHSGASGAAPVWLKLERKGSTFTASQSSTGTTWTPIGSATISMPGTVYIGLAVSSSDTGTAATATFSNVSVSGPATLLPSGWTAADVGSPAVTGVSAYANGGFSISGAGTDIWSTSDQFQFAYRQASGDVDVIARVASLQGPSGWSKGGVMVRASLAPGAAHTSMFLTPSNGFAFQRRPVDGTWSLHTSGGAGVAPAWVKLERRGSAITSFRSNDGVTWTMVGSQTLTLPSTFYVGLAVTGNNTAARATALFTNVSVVAASGSANTPPTVSLTSPTAGSTFTAPANVNIAANAADADNGVGAVEFYANGTLLGTDATSPYTYTWSGAPTGSHSLTAIARDSAGLSTTSTTVTISVGTTTNTPPSVSLTSPAGGTTYAAPATVPIAANATDADGVARVEFFANGTLIGTDTTSPYAYTWSGVAAGTYSLTAVARDSRGAVSTSAARGITVTSTTTNTPPTVSLTAPAAGSTYTAPASVTIAANAADANGTVARVDFYAGSTLVGSDTTSPYAVTWNNAPAGSFALTAVARDNAGAATTSTARGITINNPPLPTRAIFVPSPDHATVTLYRLDVFTAGANPATAAPVGQQDLGKPAIVNGECNVDIAATISGLPGGNYFATVIAISPGGTSTRTTSPTFAR
jgi:regulation of enolase protein 1 (concanavalin A-like superfamily)